MPPKICLRKIRACKIQPCKIQPCKNNLSKIQLYKNNLHKIWLRKIWLRKILLKKMRLRKLIPNQQILLIVKKWSSCIHKRINTLILLEQSWMIFSKCLTTFKNCLWCVNNKFLLVVLFLSRITTSMIIAINTNYYSTKRHKQLPLHKYSYVKQIIWFLFLY